MIADEPLDMNIRIKIEHKTHPQIIYGPFLYFNSYSRGKSMKCKVVAISTNTYYVHKWIITVWVALMYCYI
jgi:hypothetical protein